VKDSGAQPRFAPSTRAFSAPSTPSAVTIEDQIALLRDQAFHGPHRVERQNHLWVVETRQLADLALAKGMRAADAALFWIRLYGVLHDLAKHWQGAVAPATGASAKSADLARKPLLEKIVGAVRQTRAALSNEDRVFIEYRRNYEAHPIQNHYHVKRTPSGMKTECDFRLLDGATLSLETVQEITCSKLQADDDMAVARVMAESIREHLRRVEQLTGELSTSYL